MDVILLCTHTQYPFKLNIKVATRVYGPNSS